MRKSSSLNSFTMFLDLGREANVENIPFGVLYLQHLYRKSRSNRLMLYRASVLLITFLSYVAYHMSRKPISIVKNSVQFIDCAAFSSQCGSWIREVDNQKEDVAKMYLGLLDTTYLISYAIFMFFSGFVAERVNLRHFLSAGMAASGILTMMFGAAYYANIHSLWYLLLVQVISGLAQTTGWPGVVTVMANWFGKGKRGLIMGIWNSHTSVGNMLGSLIAGYYVTYNWGLSFIVPGLLMTLCSLLVFLFLVPDPSYVNMPSSGLVSPMADDMGLAGKTPSPMDFTSSLKLEINKEPSTESNNISGGGEENTDSAIGFFEALKIPGVIEFSVCLFFAKLVSYTFLYWLPNLINSISFINAKESAVLSTYFDVGGILGGILAGVVSDKSGMSATTCAFMLVTAIPTLFWYESVVSSTCPLGQISGVPIVNTCFYYNIALLVLVGLLVNGPYALITTAVSAELGTHKSIQGSSKALATVTAIIDGTGSIGAAVGPFLAGWLTGSGTWGPVFNMLVTSNVLALAFLSRLVNSELKRLRKRRFFLPG